MGLQNCGLNIDAARRELNPHGTSEFPCAGYLCRLSDLPTDAIIWHRHEELEIIYIQEGTMKLLVPGEEYHLAKGEIALPRACASPPPHRAARGGFPPS